MIQKLDSIGAQALQDIENAGSVDDLEKIRVTVLGKKGALSEVLRGLGSVGPEERPKVGAAANQWKAKIETALAGKQETLGEQELEQRIASERIDVTLPARLPHRGAPHVLTQTARRIIDVFRRIGFDVTTGPEVETEFLNFESINIPKDHPARDMQDTFFLGPGVLLRTHTSPVQIRAMLSRKWPVRVLCPGAVYRCDSDATHSPMFHQIEGLWVDRGVTMADLKGTLDFFAKEVFGSDARIRLRPAYFPFVEPGAEIDVSCFLCRTGVAGCRICKGSGWLEILGAGMVHPRLFEAAGGAYTSGGQGDVTGFAFGMGIERIAMLLHEIPDIRHFYQGDMRFLSQF